MRVFYRVSQSNTHERLEMSLRKFQKVAVLKGGPSAERDVSLRSGSAVAKGLCEAGYDVTEIGIAGHSFDLPSEIQAVFIALHG